MTAAFAARNTHGRYPGVGLSGKLLDTSALVRFVDPLPIPASAKPSGLRPSPVDPNLQIPYYRMAIRQFQMSVHRDVPPTTFWGYDASCPGPTIVTRSGNPLLVEWVNELPHQHIFPIDHTLHGTEADKPEVRTVVHLHGGRTGPESDGFPEDWFVPGQSATNYYPNRQEAAALFYHDHAMGITRLNAVAGLMGLYVIRDGFEDGLNLPKGAYEIPLVIFDRSFQPDGQIHYPVSGKTGAPWVSEYYGSAILGQREDFPASRSRAAKVPLEDLERFERQLLPALFFNGSVGHFDRPRVSSDRQRAGVSGSVGANEFASSGSRRARRRDSGFQRSVRQRDLSANERGHNHAVSRF